MKILSLIFVLVGLSLSLTACAGNVKTHTTPAMTGDYMLGIGDTVKVNVFGQEELTGEFKVEPNGAIPFPLIQDVPASGRTAKDLETDIANKLSPQYIVDPRVSVEVVSYRNIYILGEVNQPGKFEYIPNMTMLQAVAIAGGYTYRANESSAEVTRHVKGALKTFTVDETTMLKPGDTIVIKRRWF